MASDFLPDDVEPLTPDEALAALEAADAPPLTEDAVLADDPPRPIGRSWAFAFSGEELGFDRGRSSRGPLETYEDDTLMMWVEKTLRTARGAHPVYPSEYGMDEPLAVIGRYLTTEDYARLESNITDALLFHPRIVDVTDFSADQDPDDEVLEVSFTIVKDDSSSTPMSLTVS